GSERRGRPAPDLDVARDRPLRSRVLRVLRGRRPLAPRRASRIPLVVRARSGRATSIRSVLRPWLAGAALPFGRGTSAHARATPAAPEGGPPRRTHRALPGRGEGAAGAVARPSRARLGGVARGRRGRRCGAARAQR